jgi:hypothetical protein
MAFPDPRDRNLTRHAEQVETLAADLCDWLSEFNPARKAADLLPVAESDEFEVLLPAETADGRPGKTIRLRCVTEPAPPKRSCSAAWGSRSPAASAGSRSWRKRPNRPTKCSEDSGPKPNVSPLLIRKPPLQLRNLA